MHRWRIAARHGSQRLARPGELMVARGGETPAVSDVEPVIEMAAFESADTESGGPRSAALTWRDTVSRSTPSSAAIRRYDHLRRASPMIA
jgi:hypothetical protein